jgi:hypothetical protein
MENNTKSSASSASEGNTRHPINKPLKIKILGSAAISLYWVLFLWGVWERDINALGMNAFLFWTFLIALFFWALRNQGHYIRKDLVWIAPMGLIAVSFFIYDNPFIKVISMLVFPVLGALFINYGFLADKDKRRWNQEFVLHMIARLFSFFGKLNESFAHLLDYLIPKDMKKRSAIIKSLKGIALFLLVSLTVIIPLLSSADAEFAGKMGIFFSFVKNIISETIIYKIVAFAVLAITLLSFLLAWTRRFDYKEKEEESKKIDPIVSGIVIGGILILYLLFLWLQLKRLWVGALPFDFKETENLVKSGFWQLFFLSIINIIIYFSAYRRTNKKVQGLLSAFTAASLLLLISAGHRMALYAIYYGFSYEKFFASYTILYSGILFVWLIYRLYRKDRADIFKFLVMLFLWMFSLIAVFPVEEFIFRANLALVKKKDSRIRLYEMTMLSPDVLGSVKQAAEEGRLKEKTDYLEREGAPATKRDFDWEPWIKKQEDLIAKKKWYEKNLMNILQD